jgi:hypothetical protein
MRTKAEGETRVREGLGALLGVSPESDAVTAVLAKLRAHSECLALCGDTHRPGVCDMPSDEPGQFNPDGSRILDYGRATSNPKAWKRRAKEA